MMIEIIRVCTASLSFPSLAGSLMVQRAGFGAACVVDPRLAEEPHDGQVYQRAFDTPAWVLFKPGRTLYSQY